MPETLLNLGLFGLQKKTTGSPLWPAAAEAMNATAQIQPRAGFIARNIRNYLEDPRLIGSVGSKRMRRGRNQVPNETIPLLAQFDGRQNLLAALLYGKDTVSQVDDGTATAVGHQHFLELHDTLIDKLASMAMRYQSADGLGLGIIELDSIKAVREQLRWQTDGFLEHDVEVFIRRVLEEENESADMTNTDTEINAMGVGSEPGGLVLPEHVKFWVALQSAGALSSSNLVGVRSIDFQLSRQLGDDAPTDESFPYPIQPVPTGKGLSYSATIGLANVNNQDFQKWHNSETPLKAEIHCEGALLTGASTEKFRFLRGLPELVVSDYQPGGDRVGATVTLSGAVADSAPTGMLSRFPYGVLVNEESAALI